MGKSNGIYRKVLIAVIVIILPFVLVPGLDIKSATLISLGFATSLSLWGLSMNHESSFASSQSKKN